MTALPPAPPLAPGWPGAGIVPAAALAFLVTGAAMGVDLPGSRRRLSRLA